MFFVLNAIVHWLPLFNSDFRAQLAATVSVHMDLSTRDGSDVAAVKKWLAMFSAPLASISSSSSSAVPYSSLPPSSNQESPAVESKASCAMTLDSSMSTPISQASIAQFFASTGEAAPLSHSQHGHGYEAKKQSSLKDLSTLAQHRQYCDCKNARCAASRRVLTEAQCLAVRTHYADLGSEAARLAFLSSYCILNRDGLHVHYAIAEQPLCYKAFCHIVGCSPGKLFHARTMAAQHAHSIHRLENRPAPKSDESHAWLSAFGN